MTVLKVEITVNDPATAKLHRKPFEVFHGLNAPGVTWEQMIALADISEAFARKVREHAAKRFPERSRADGLQEDRQRRGHPHGDPRPEPGEDRPQGVDGLRREGPGGGEP